MQVRVANSVFALVQGDYHFGAISHKATSRESEAIFAHQADKIDFLPAEASFQDFLNLL